MKTSDRIHPSLGILGPRRPERQNDLISESPSLHTADTFFDMPPEGGHPNQQESGKPSLRRSHCLRRPSH